MRELSLIVLGLMLMSFMPVNSPHGKDLSIGCGECHNPNGWKINRSNMSFKHNTTRFKLIGLHKDANCVSCHTTLVFSEAKPECMACHEDVHEQTVGFDCGRCHTPNSWLVDNITEIHQQSRFPLLGAHSTADCYDCHLNSPSTLRFDPIGVNCVDCHLKEYQATTEPNHVENLYTTECSQCHQMNAFSWSSANITHNFFPLTDGHNIKDCAKCHLVPNNYSNISAECVSCHQNDYTNSTLPNHVQLNFTTNCIECHTTSLGWKPAKFANHDVLFPIYSGKHNDAWSSCTDCHKVADNYAVFTCIDCHDHNKSDMDSKHGEVGGYLYESNACFSCHPNGNSEGSFNHAASNFPLTGAHVDAECASCHTTGYAGTSTICVDCHLPDFNQSVNPSHTQINLSTDCKVCHTTNPGWKPATFDVHNQFYPLTGAHTQTDCASCHNGNYTNTPNSCFGCHEQVFNQTTNPPHASSQFSTDCIICHTQIAWIPSTFDHNAYFPINSGEHNGLSCIDCHTIPSDYSLFSCIDCHDHNQSEMDSKHSGVANYQYNSDACYSCHPTGNGGDFGKNHFQPDIR